MNVRFPTQMGKMMNMGASEENACLKIAQKISVLVGDYVDPYGMRLYPAKGYWSHLHQDVQRFTGISPRNDLPKLKWTIGSWELTISQIAKGCKFNVLDRRGQDQRIKEADFIIEKAI